MEATDRLVLIDRTIISNVPTIDTAPANLSSLIMRLNQHIFTPLQHHPSSADAKAHIEAIDNAIDLCTRLLRLDATKRLTAAAALRHPFLRPKTEESMEDMEDEEILGGEDGKCGYLHGIEDGKRPCNFLSCIQRLSLSSDRAFFARNLQDMQFGQGIPVSRDQCKLSFPHSIMMTDFL